MKNKKGISAIVATVLIILITVAAVTIIWAAIIPMVIDDYPLIKLHQEACVLEKYDGETFEIYDDLYKLMERIEEETNSSIDSYAAVGEWAGCSGNEECDNIQCQFNAELCHPSGYKNGYCEDIKLNLIVKYDEWVEWKNE